MGVFSISFILHAFQFDVISIFHWNAPGFCAWVVNANTKLAVFRADIGGPILPTLSCLGAHSGQSLISLWAKTSMVLLPVWPGQSSGMLSSPCPGCCSAVPALPQQVSSCLSSGVSLFEGEILNFCLFCRAGVCSLPPAPVASLPLVRFSLSILHLFQFNCHWGGTITRLYIDLISVKFCSLWTRLVKFMM